MGLERFIVGRFGTTPQIDLDKQIARVRLTRPDKLDFAEFADAIVRNNMGVGGFRFYSQARIEEREVVIEPTQQRFPLKGSISGPRESGMRWFKVEGWKKGSSTGLTVQAERP